VDLLWTDIETTGLDERGGLLLELGLIVTGPGPRFEERAAWSAVVGYPDIRSRIRSSYVREMHEANGLLVEVERSRLTLAELEARACSWVRDRHATDLPMGGSSPHFDRRWLKEHTPELAGLYHHRMIDATTLRILFGFDKPASSHRALGDLRVSLGFVRELGPFLDPEARQRFTNGMVGGFVDKAEAVA
jgi:oligoribonuclease (3'-5' exoribonuclease)